jgi:hypothetical protein
MDSSALNHLLSRELYEQRVLAAERARIARAVADARVAGLAGGFPAWYTPVKMLGAMRQTIRRAAVRHPLTRGHSAR